MAENESEKQMGEKSIHDSMGKEHDLMSELTDEARYKAGKSQMFQYLNNQYIAWHLIAVESIRRIILNAEEFYADIVKPDGAFSDVASPEMVNHEIRIGWLYEAVSHAEQAIEDFFSLLKKATSVDWFTKDVVVYNATEVKDYIWKFKTDDIEYILKQFHLPYFDLEQDAEWENKECFEAYKEAVLLIQKYLKELVEFHKHYYQDYCQYKHGMSVCMRADRGVPKNPTKGAFRTYDCVNIGTRMNQTKAAPMMAIELFPETQPYVSRLHEERNLLYFTVHVADLDRMEDITEKAYILLNVLRTNLLRMGEFTEKSKMHELAFPCEDRRKLLVIGFPLDVV